MKKWFSDIVYCYQNDCIHNDDGEVLSVLQYNVMRFAVKFKFFLCMALVLSLLGALVYAVKVFLESGHIILAILAGVLFMTVLDMSSDVVIKEE